MPDVRIAPLAWVLRELLNYNPFFIYGGRNPLLHQTEVVAKSLFVRPTRIFVADAIGLGKTVTALRLLKLLDRYRPLKWVLIVVPSVLVEQWKDELRSMGIPFREINRRELPHLASYSRLPPGWYLGSVDTLKQPEYIALLKNVSWDAIVVDEAHKLGIIGAKPNLRWQSLGELIRSNRSAVVIFLSATPHRGKANDFLARLALLDPTLLDVANVGTLERTFDRPEFYRRMHCLLLHRRIKDDVNKFYEKREVFKPAMMMAVLIVPTETEKRLVQSITDLALKYLDEYYAYLVNEVGLSEENVVGIISLLRTLLVKRGLSSPLALLTTFTNIVEKRGMIYRLTSSGVPYDVAKTEVVEKLEEFSKDIEEVLSGDIGDEEEEGEARELDDLFNKVAEYMSDLLPSSIVEELRHIKNLAEDILNGKAPDSKLETLKRILRLVVEGKPEELSEEFKELPSGKAIVFTEFKDTAYYLFIRLREWAEKELGDPRIVRVLTSDNRDEIEDIKKWLAERGPRILITTDVAGEGLNLQAANVLVNYEITWSPIKLEQRVGRVWRYGQEKTTYVFNLFLADALEKEVADVVFRKLYGISVSVGSLEPIIGEKVYLSEIRNELLEHAVREAQSIGGLIPVEIEVDGKTTRLTEPKIIELVSKDAKKFVEAFIATLSRLVKEQRETLPSKCYLNVETGVRDELERLSGFRDIGDAVEAVKLAAKAIGVLAGASVEENKDTVVVVFRDGRRCVAHVANPEKAAEELLGCIGKVEATPKYFVFQGDAKEVLLVATAEISVGGETRYREPVAVAYREGSETVAVLRGRQLIEKLAELLPRSLPVDELYGMDSVMDLAREVRRAAVSAYYGVVGRAVSERVIRRLREYEETKKRLARGAAGLVGFFATEEPKVNIGEPLYIFISTAFLPEAREKPSTEVWMWTEEKAIPIVVDYEKRSGREAAKVSGHEHYDVRSTKTGSDGRVVEERFIEVKTKAGRDISVNLTESEYGVAKEKGDRYWLYIVYGAGTERPAILCVKNPAQRLAFKRVEEQIKQARYVFSTPNF